VVADVSDGVLGATVVAGGALAPASLDDDVERLSLR